MASNKSKPSSTKSSPAPIVAKPAGNAPGTIQVQNVKTGPTRNIRELKKP
jgi:hypothetical protein